MAAFWSLRSAKSTEGPIAWADEVRKGPGRTASTGVSARYAEYCTGVIALRWRKVPWISPADFFAMPRERLKRIQNNRGN